MKRSLIIGGALVLILVVGSVIAISVRGDDTSTATTNSETTVTTADKPPLVQLEKIPADKRKSVPWDSVSVVDDGSRIEVLFNGGTPMPACGSADIDVRRIDAGAVEVATFNGPPTVMVVGRSCLARAFPIRAFVDISPPLRADATFTDPYVGPDKLPPQAR